MPKTIEEILEDLCHNTMGNPPYRIKEATQAIKELLKSKVPEERKIAPYEPQNYRNEGYNQAISEFTQIIEGL